MNIKNKSISIIWLFPFAAFICGYLLTRSFCMTKTVSIPALIGLTIEYGAKLASDNQLGIQIIAEKYDPDLQPGTIINQKPHAHQTARQHQLIYVVIAKHPETKKTPDLQGKTIEQAVQELKKSGLNHKIILLPIESKSVLILTQQPQAQQPILEPIFLYTTARSQSYVLPDLRTKPLEQVQVFLEKHELPTTITYDRPHAKAYTVEQQRPLPGTIFSEHQKPTIQLLAKAV